MTRIETVKMYIKNNESFLIDQMNLLEETTCKCCIKNINRDIHFFRGFIAALKNELRYLEQEGSE